MPFFLFFRCTIDTFCTSNPWYNYTKDWRKGQWLNVYKSFNIKGLPNFIGINFRECRIKLEGPYNDFSIPIVVNTHSYLNVEAESTAEVIDFDYDLYDPEGTAEMLSSLGWRSYLDTLSGTTFAHESADQERFHEAMMQSVTGSSSEFETYQTSSHLLPLTGNVSYGKHEGPTGEVLEAIPTGIYWNEVSFRPGYDEEWWLRREYELKLTVTGLMDIENLGLDSSGPVQAPADLYLPPTVNRIYDAEGNPLLEPESISPSMSPGGYIQQPPLLLTNMETARLIRGEDSIGSIRVKVKGANEFSLEGQQKLERLAAEIVELTGLEVDILAGSSLIHNTVYIPGYEDIPSAGYIDELWVQKGVNTEIRDRIRWENLFFFGIVLLVAGLYVGNTALLTTLERQGEIGIWKALGWSAWTISSRILFSFFGLALIAGLIGILVAYLSANILGLTPALSQMVAVVPISVGMALMGGAIGLLVARSATPLSAIRSKGINTDDSSQSRIGSSVMLSLAWNSLIRRRGTTGVTLAVITVATGFLVLLVLLLESSRGYLSGTLLGTYIMVRIEGYHLAMAGIAMAVAVIAAVDSGLLGISQRKHELALLLAVGWDKKSLGRLVILEGILIGLAGSLLGLVVGGISYFALTGILGGTYVMVALVPLVVIPVAYLLVANQAGKISLASALRSE